MFHGSWLRARVSSQQQQKAGCTKHICGVGQGAVASVSTAAKLAARCRREFLVAP
jgi:hypothetical protein